MAEHSFPWPDTSDPGPTMGDGRKITAEEQAKLFLTMFTDGVVPYDNKLAVSSPGNNAISVNTGAAIVYGRFYTNNVSLSLAPTSAPAGQSRKDSVILQLDWDGSGGAQYTVRAKIKQGTAVDYPSMTQTVNVLWQMRLYNYTIDDAGVITGITDMRTYCQFNTEVITAMLVDGILSADAAGRAKMAAGFFGANATSRAAFANSFFDATTVNGKFAVDSFTNTVLLRLIQDGAFAADAATRALFADKFITLAKIADGSACSVVGRSANSGGVYADIAAGTNGQVLRRSAGALGFGTIGADSITAATDLQPKQVNVDTVDGLHAADIAAGGVIVGAIIMWSGTLGGSDGHRPMVGGVANEDWHLCNGDVVGSVTTPDLRNRFVVGAGSTYVKGATGGATTASHNHGKGALAAANESAHTHDLYTFEYQMIAGGTSYKIGLEHAYTKAGSGHTHSISGYTDLAAPSILPPYYGLYYIMKVA